MRLRFEKERSAVADVTGMARVILSNLINSGNPCCNGRISFNKLSMLLIYFASIMFLTISNCGDSLTISIPHSTASG